MPRSIWNGSIAFGLVNVPVRLYSATESKQVQFHQFEKGTKKRIEYRRVTTGTKHEVDYDDIVKGYEVSKGKYVTITPEELESVEPGRSRTLDIEDFVLLEEIDPVYFDKSYYLEPVDGAEKAYALLVEAMSETGRVAVGRFVMRTKQYLATVRPTGDVLVLETMFFGDEVRDPKDLKVPTRVKVPPKEKRIATQLIESLTVPFDPDAYKDTYRSRVLGLIRRKAKGQEIEVKPREKAADVVDLMAALEASLQERKKPKRKAS